MGQTEPETDDLDEYRERADAIIGRERDILDTLAEWTTGPSVVIC